jgi:Repeat of Unknown Function (DUF347)
MVNPTVRHGRTSESPLSFPTFFCPEEFRHVSRQSRPRTPRRRRHPSAPGQGSQITSIRTRRREAFYWAAVLLTFALGTAAGDWTASSLQLGYFPSGLIFLVAFLLPALAYRRFGMNPVLAFWLSYTVTRPLSALTTYVHRVDNTPWQGWP